MQNTTALLFAILKQQCTSATVQTPLGDISWVLQQCEKGLRGLCSCQKCPPQLTSIPKMTVHLTVPCGRSVAGALLMCQQCFHFPREFTSGGQTPKATRTLHGFIVTHPQCHMRSNEPLHLSCLPWFQLENVWAKNLPTF